MTEYEKKATYLFDYYQSLGNFLAIKEESLGKEILNCAKTMKDNFKIHRDPFINATQKLKEIEVYIAKADLEFNYPDIPQNKNDVDIFLFQDRNYKDENTWLA